MIQDVNSKLDWMREKAKEVILSIVQTDQNPSSCFSPESTGLLILIWQVF
jgi:hypothetical protein